MLAITDPPRIADEAGRARRDDPVAEWRRCALLRQPDIDRLLSAGVPVLALAEAWWGGMCLMRDRVVVDGARFEFGRYAAALDAREAFLVLAFDRNGQPADLVAFRGGEGGFVASWLGVVGRRRARSAGAGGGVGCGDDDGLARQRCMDADVGWIAVGRAAWDRNARDRREARYQRRTIHVDCDGLPVVEVGRHVEVDRHRPAGRDCLTTH